MAFILVVAMDKNGCIGCAGELPWGDPIFADMLHFRTLTVGQTIVMGSKTWKSIGSKPLEGRTNIVLTRNTSLEFLGVNTITMHSADEVRALNKKNPAKNIFIIGGAEIYKEFLFDAVRCEITVVHGKFEGDTYFPETSPQEWKRVIRRFIRNDLGTDYDLEFLTMERVGTASSQTVYK